MGNYPPSEEPREDNLRQVEVSQEELTRLRAGEQVTVNPSGRIAVGNKGEIIEVNISEEGIIAEKGGVKARIIEKDTIGSLDGTFILEKVE
jgi:hypothetical protein